MVATPAWRLAPVADRIDVRQADAAHLPFADATFTAVLSFAMLHNVVDWPAALDEAVRVLRPGGHLIGYDLLASRPVRWLHQAEGPGYRMMTVLHFVPV